MIKCIKKIIKKYKRYKSNKNIKMKIYLDVKKEKIIYCFDKYSCYKKLTGKCSLELDSPILKYREQENSSNKFEHCKELAEYLKKGETKIPLYMDQKKDNKIYITDGQHRACIGQKLGLKLPTYFSCPRKNIRKYISSKKIKNL